MKNGRIKIQMKIEKKNIKKILKMIKVKHILKDPKAYLSKVFLVTGLIYNSTMILYYDISLDSDCQLTVFLLNNGVCSNY